MSNNVEGLLVVAVIIIGDICIISLMKLLKPLFRNPQKQKEIF